MAQQLHKRFSTEQVIMLLEKYLNDNVGLTYIWEILGIKKTGFSSFSRSIAKIRRTFPSATEEKGHPER